MAAVSFATGCSDSPKTPLVGPATPGPTLPPRPPDCLPLLAEPPGTVAGEGLRAGPDDAGVLTWGDPPIVLDCGVPRPSAFTVGVQLFDVNGVQWFVAEGGSATTYTAVDRNPYVEVTVPSQYAGATVLADLADSVLALPQRKPVPRRSASSSNRSTSAG